MADEQDRMTEPLGVFSRPEPVVGFGPAELVASLLAVVWVVAVVAYAIVSPRADDGGFLGLVMTLLVVFLPLALIWASAYVCAALLSWSGRLSPRPWVARDAGFMQDAG